MCDFLAYITVSAKVLCIFRNTFWASFCWRLSQFILFFTLIRSNFRTDMGCRLPKLRKTEERRSPGNIYSTLRRPQVETKVGVSYTYHFLDFLLGKEGMNNTIYHKCSPSLTVAWCPFKLSLAHVVSLSRCSPRGLKHYVNWLTSIMHHFPHYRFLTWNKPAALRHRLVVGYYLLLLLLCLIII